MGFLFAKKLPALFFAGFACGGKGGAGWTGVVLFLFLF